MEAAEGGGRSAVPSVGRGGGGIRLNVGGFKRGGSSEGNVTSVGVVDATELPLCCGDSSSL